MRHNSRISTVSILGVLCMCITGTAAHAAASVRSLGGAGTYTGTASAGGTTATATTASNTSAATRAGSVRVTPTTNKTSTSASISTGNTSAARGAATSRLSIGKYLGSAITTGGKPLRPNISNGGNVNNGDTVISGDVEKIVYALQGRVEEIETLVGNVRPKAGDYVIVSNDSEISVDFDTLAAALATQIGGDVGMIDIKLDDKKENIVWCQADPDAQCTYNHLISVADLTGPQGEQGPQGEPGESVDMEKLETLLNEKILAEIGKLNLKALASQDTVGIGQIDNGAVVWDNLSTDVQGRIQTGGTVELPDNLVTTEKLNDELAPLKTGIDTNTAAIVANTGAINTNTANIATNTENISTNATAIAANTTAITTNTTNITANANAIAANTEALKQKANAADVYKKSETYSQEQIDKKLEGITAGGVGAAPDDANYAWVSLGGKQQWISVAGAIE